MIEKLLRLTKLLSASITFAAFLQGPLAARTIAPDDEAAVRFLIASTFQPYIQTQSIVGSDPVLDNDGVPENSDISEYELPYTASLGTLINRWKPIASGDEVYELNDFDWYCQCQDFDTKTATLKSQKYMAASADKIVATTRFSAGWGSKPSPLIFMFKREGGKWLLDDLRFESGRTLRQGLLGDIKDAALETAKKPH